MQWCSNLTSHAIGCGRKHYACYGKITAEPAILHSAAALVSNPSISTLCRPPSTTLHAWKPRHAPRACTARLVTGPIFQPEAAWKPRALSHTVQLQPIQCADTSTVRPPPGTPTSAAGQCLLAHGSSADATSLAGSRASSRPRYWRFAASRPTYLSPSSGKSYCQQLYQLQQHRRLGEISNRYVIIVVFFMRQL